MDAIGLLILRLGMGALMLTHGWGKAQMLIAGEFEKFPDPLGMGQTMSLVGAAGAEVGGALLVMVGFLTRLGALSVAFTMGVAAFVIHGADPWFMGPGVSASKEPALTLLIVFLAIALTGAGRFSLDAKLFGGKGGDSSPPKDAAKDPA